MQFHPKLSQPHLVTTVRSFFTNNITDSRVLGRCTFSMTDTLTSALAMFQLKSPSLLQFDEGCRDNEATEGNLQTLYHIQNVPSDTQARSIVDEVNPRELRDIFVTLVNQVKSSKGLHKFVFYKKKYLIAVDGTGYFSSHSVHCESCCEKNHKDGSVTYYHQALGAAIIHPDIQTVIPLCPEPIILQDGTTKNDCERNAAQRFLEDLRTDHPDLEAIITEDALASNAPHIETLRRLNFSFILGVKPGDHESLYADIDEAEKHGMVEELIVEQNGITYHYRWVNGLAINASNPDCIINFLEVTILKKNETKTVFSWVTDLDLNKSSVEVIAEGGRARWKIENETFNTLKNQGYHFEHNFGHGYKNLSVVYMMLMFLAFLMDQILQLSCHFFQKSLILLQLFTYKYF